VTWIFFPAGLFSVERSWQAEIHARRADSSTSHWRRSGGFALVQTNWANGEEGELFDIDDRRLGRHFKGDSLRRAVQVGQVYPCDQMVSCEEMARNWMEGTQEERKGRSQGTDALTMRDVVPSKEPGGSSGLGEVMGRPFQGDNLRRAAQVGQVYPCQPVVSCEEMARSWMDEIHEERKGRFQGTDTVILRGVVPSAEADGSNGWGEMEVAPAFNCAKIRERFVWGEGAIPERISETWVESVRFGAPAESLFRVPPGKKLKLEMTPLKGKR
jgi:hypothetical protein